MDVQRVQNTSDGTGVLTRLLRVAAIALLTIMLVACDSEEAAPRPDGPVVAAPDSSVGTAAQTTAPLIVDDAAAANASLVETRLRVPDGLDGAPETVRLPAGFRISLLATGLDAPRFMALDSAGNLLVADAQSGAVYRYPSDGAGSILPSGTPPAPLLRGLNRPSNIALFTQDGQQYLYVGETTQVARYRYSPTGAAEAREVVIADLPAGGHSTRTIAFGPDGRLYLAVGSSCNICEERDERRAAVLRYNPDGSGYERFASGLRNPVGLAFQPGTDTLWATVNERDNQGNEIPPDLVTIVQQEANYGWPSCQPPEARPQTPDADCTRVTPPTVGIQAHSAPLGLAFYTGDAAPAAYHGDIIVAQHGSWNRQPPAAPKLLRVHLEGGRPVAVEDFATGWQEASGRRWGRPAGVVVALDGSLIISDDQAGVLYRISYES